jgi:hypothetical protein
MARGKPLVDHTGKRFGRLTVIELAGRKKAGSRMRPAWLCRCECGKETVVVSQQLCSGTTNSCGCLQRETARVVNSTHGRSRTAEHRIWMHMRARCLSPTDASYPNYGGRWIRVCRRWNRFENFIEDMGQRPSQNHTIERIDNDGPYSAANCVWATRAQQNKNTRKVRSVVFDGKSRLLVDLAHEYGINPRNLRKRIDKGVPIGIALRPGRLPADWRSIFSSFPR